MKTTRKRYSADFKAKVALEAIRGDLTLAELVAKHGIHHTMIAAWKRQAIDGMASTFYPYLLRHLAIDRPNHVWRADITYIPMRRGFLYLVAIMDWATRKSLPRT